MTNYIKFINKYIRVFCESIEKFYIFSKYIIFKNLKIMIPTGVKKLNQCGESIIIAIILGTMAIKVRTHMLLQIFILFH